MKIKVSTAVWAIVIPHLYARQVDGCGRRDTPAETAYAQILVERAYPKGNARKGNQWFITIY